MDRCVTHKNTKCPMPCPVCLINERDQLQAELEKLKAWQEIMQNDVDKAHDDEVELLILRDENKRLKQALGRYGQHLPSCKYITWENHLPVGQDLKNCNCGLEQALKKKENEPGKSI